jgi:hypothetical protein
MKRIGLLAAAITVALTLVCISSATAAQFPNVLPLGAKAEPVTSENTSGESVFGTGLLSVKSTKSKGEASETSEKPGTYHFDLEELELLGTKCVSLEDTTKPGTILSLGRTDILDAKEAGKLITVMALLLERTHFTCGETLIVGTGCLAGKLLPETGKLVSETKVDLETVEQDNKIIKVENATLTGEFNCELLASVNGGPATLSSIKQTLTVKGFKIGTKATEVFIMAD